jgi:hypothetical protein
MEKDMSWIKKKYPEGEDRYNSMRDEVQENLNKGRKTPEDYMHSYKYHIEKQNYEEAKAISDVLDLLGWDVKHTHGHIPSLNKKK